MALDGAKANEEVTFTVGEDGKEGEFRSFRHGYAGTIYKGQGRELELQLPLPLGALAFVLDAMRQLSAAPGRGGGVRLAGDGAEHSAVDGGGGRLRGVVAGAARAGGAKLRRVARGEAGAGEARHESRTTSPMCRRDGPRTVVAATTSRGLRGKWGAGRALRGLGLCGGRRRAGSRGSGTDGLAEAAQPQGPTKHHNETFLQEPEHAAGKKPGHRARPDGRGSPGGDRAGVGADEDGQGVRGALEKKDWALARGDPGEA